MSVTAARGFRAAGLHCGVKEDGSPDLALSAAVDRSAAATVFTASATVAPAAAVVLGRVDVGAGRPARAAAGRVARCVDPVHGFPVSVGLPSVGWLS